MDNEGIYQVYSRQRDLPAGLRGFAGRAGERPSSSTAKALEAAPITMSASIAASTLGLVFVLILPAAVLAVGAVVVLLRRRR